jgi:oligoendopeptidase F
MFTSLPNDARTLLKWSWTEIQPYYDDLAQRTLDASSVAEWLADWTALDDRVSELQSRHEVMTSQNTADKQAEEDYNQFLDTIYPRVEAASQKLREKLIASGLEPENFTVPLKKMRAEAALFREANLPLLVEEHKLSNRYDQIVGAQTVEWDGKEVTISQLRPVLLETDRSRREKAWRLSLQRQLANRQPLNELWQTFLTLRRKLAANAGLQSFRDFRWQQLLRFDYTPADCLRFHQAIEIAVVPAAKRLYDKRRRQLGVNTLKPWDLQVDPLGRPPLKPFKDADELKAVASSLFHRVDPPLGNYFDIMVHESLLDLSNRKNKAPGAYCTGFPMSHRPFIFSNAVGLHDDLQTVLHESGHAFHFMERDGLPYAQQKQVGMEFAEVASMSMELLAAPYLARGQGGVYVEGDAVRARVEHLESVILFWPYMAVVDAFQHWVYENPDAAADPSKCDAEWAVQWDRFMGGVDWSGLDQEMMTGWQRKLHIFEVPFYYVEYGLAQLGATQIWRNALSDQAGAVAAYRRALALGGTVSLPELYNAAGAKLAFDAETLGAMVTLAERTIDELERHAG